MYCSLEEARRAVTTCLEGIDFPAAVLTQTEPERAPWKETRRRLAAALARDQRVEAWPLLPELAREPSIDPDR